MADSSPLVSIGLPVFNGEAYLRRALDSLLAQDYPNFELIVSDNASTDGTQAICQEFAARDSRLKVYRNETNLGSVFNFNRVFELSSGKYFAWAGNDDWWESGFISKCVMTLERNPDAVLCYTLAQFVDRAGQHMAIIDSDVTTRGLMRLERLHTAILRLNSAEAIYGMMRSESLRKTIIVQDCFGPDKSLIYQLAILGHIVKVPEVLHHYRLVEKSWEEYAEQTTGFADARQSPPMPKTSLVKGVIEAVWKLPIPMLQKPVLMLDAVYCLNRRYNHRFRQEYKSLRLFWLQKIKRLHIKNAP